MCDDPPAKYGGKDCVGDYQSSGHCLLLPCNAGKGDSICWVDAGKVYNIRFGFNNPPYHVKQNFITPHHHHNHHHHHKHILNYITTYLAFQNYVYPTPYYVRRSQHGLINT